MQIWAIHVIFLWLLAASSKLSVKWRIGSRPMDFGKSLILNCTVPPDVCKPGQTRQWSGGGYKVLTMNGVSIDKNKYIMETSGTSLDFSLVIKNLSHSDLDSDYTCICGESQYTQILKLIYIPVELDIEDLTSIDNASMYLHIDIIIKKISPVPLCFIEFLGVDRQINRTGLTANTEQFYEVHLESYILIEHQECNFAYVLKCQLIQETYRIHKNYTDVCGSTKDMDHGVKLYMILVPVLIVVVIIILICVFLCFRLYRRKMKEDIGEKNIDPTERNNLEMNGALLQNSDPSCEG